MSVRDADRALRLGGACPLCDALFQMGDRAAVIGHVDAYGDAELRFAHIVCLLRDTVGDAVADAYEAGELGDARVDLRRALGGEERPDDGAQ